MPDDEQDWEKKDARRRKMPFDYGFLKALYHPFGVLV
jgi:hypothetical protein